MSPNRPGPSLPSVGIDAGASLWKLARVGEDLDLHLVPAGAVEEVRRWLLERGARTARVTGGGTARLAAILEGVEVQPVVEFEAWARGAPVLAARGAMELPDRYLLVSLGTGTSVLEVGAGAAVVRVGGMALGGGTLLGLARLLCGTDRFQEIVDLAARGERSRVDLLVGDVYPASALEAVALDPALTASSFAKLSSRDPRDLAHALLGLLGENVGIATSAMAQARGVETLVFGGSPLEGNPPLQEILRAVVAMSGRRALLLPEGGYCGAVGAALSQ